MYAFFLERICVLSCQMRSGNRDRWRTWSLDPPPLGEAACMDFHGLIGWSISELIGRLIGW